MDCVKELGAGSATRLGGGGGNPAGLSSRSKNYAFAPPGKSYRASYIWAYTIRRKADLNSAGRGVARDQAEGVHDVKCAGISRKKPCTVGFLRACGAWSSTRTRCGIFDTHLSQSCIVTKRPGHLAFSLNGRIPSSSATVSTTVLALQGLA